MDSLSKKVVFLCGQSKEKKRVKSIDQTEVVKLNMEL